MSEKQKNLIVRTITGVLFVAIMVAGFLRPDAMILLFCIIAGMAVWEYTGLVNGVDGVRVNRFISTVAAVYLVVAVAAWRVQWVAGFVVMVPYVLTIMYLFIEELYLKQKNPVADWAYTMLGQMFVAAPLALVSVLAFQSNSAGLPTYDMLLPLSLFIFLWVNDSGAYCCGSLLGRHKLFPRISPGKTWEGSAGGAVFVLVAAAVVGWLSASGRLSDAPSQLSIPAWLGLGLVVVVFGTWGDLVESLFKRTLGLKDSGSILPGHGGMLDRFDSALMAIPAAVVYLYTLQL